MLRKASVNSKVVWLITCKNTDFGVRVDFLLTTRPDYKHGLGGNYFEGRSASARSRNAGTSASVSPPATAVDAIPPISSAARVVS